MNLRAFAPAKVNLFLHVGAPRADGRHPICSLVVFADVGDRLEAEPADAPALVVDGPFADQAGPDADNLVTRALASLGAAPMSVRLTKALPAAAGLGGGSSDAGAALRLARQLDPDVTPERLERVARALGADGVMCLYAQACVAEGEGEVLTAAPEMQRLPAVLLNPGVPSPTGAVYRAYDEGPGRFSADRPPMPDRLGSIQEVAAFLRRQRNDLEAPAIRRQPRIADALVAMEAQAGVLLSRMSGSGATVFGLFADSVVASAASERLAVQFPQGWVRACHLNAPREPG